MSNLRQYRQVMIPEELLADILKRLPVKSLIRFRCVCKSWNSLLSSPFFATHHCTFTNAACSARRRRTSLQVLYRLGQHANPTCTLYLPQDNTFTTLDSPLHRPQHFFNCLGVVHGVVICRYSPSLILEPSIQFTKDVPSAFIVLWNPVIGKYVDTPWPDDNDHSKYSNFIGFGFDSRKGDLKAVITGRHYYEVFSARDSLWRRNPLPHHLKPLFSSYVVTNCFVNGTIYWVTTLKNHGRFELFYGLLLFDCVREEFRTIDLPEQLRVQPLRPKVFVWGDLVTIVTVSSTSCGMYELWTMQEDGDKVTWIRTDNTDGDIIIGCLTLTRRLNKELAQFECIYSYDKDNYVFEESMLLMDIGKPCDPDQARLDVEVQSSCATREQ